VVYWFVYWESVSNSYNAYNLLHYIAH